MIVSLKRVALLVFAVATVTLAAGMANATSVDTTNSFWTDAVDGTIDNSGTPKTVSWGSGTQSSYAFTGVNNLLALPSNIGDMTVFKVGDFTHNNFPIGPPILSEVTLTLDLGIVNGAIFSGQFDFLFNHEETPNNVAVLSDCGPDQLSGTMCDDIVTIANVSTPIAFMYNDMLFTLEMLGFSQDGGGTILEKFVTVENSVNEAGLYAKITKIKIPEPGTLALFGIGLFALGVLRRRRSPVA